MIQDIKNVCSRKHIKYLILLLLGMFIAAAIEMIGLGSIPMFIVIIIDIDILIDKFPTFFANDYIKKYKARLYNYFWWNNINSYFFNQKYLSVIVFIFSRKNN